MCNSTGVCVWCSPQVEEFSRGTSEHLSFNSVSLFLDTTGLKFMSLLVPRFKFLMRLSKEILKLNRIRQRYISNIGFLNFTANQTPSMVNWWGFCWRSGIQHRFNISSFDPPFFEPRMNFSTKTMTRWWFQIFFVFTPTWKRFPI